MNCKLRRLDLLRNGQKSDCELHVSQPDKLKEGKRCPCIFRCHQVMLISASAEFERLIRDPEFQKNKRVISVDDASPTAYEALLLYIYTYEVCNALTIDMCGDLMLLAERYEMLDFIDCYIDKLAHQEWPMEVVLQVFHLASEHHHPALMDLVAKKILPVATQVLEDNSFLKLSVKELKALMIILKKDGDLSDHELLTSLKNYQEVNNLRYENMEQFQQLVEVTQLFGHVLFEVDGTIVVPEEPEPSPEE
ncbi:GM10382 [Drosophila sechellia]|uniref:GM10382 n=2 Tax=Drosophila sechellia TaxID=7238 RepID=B4IC72_DROSE|nr:GM10382 [Drosophila sechellia]